MNGMHMDELNQKVCGRLVRGEDAAVGCLSMGAWLGMASSKQWKYLTDFPLWYNISIKKGLLWMCQEWM